MACWTRAKFGIVVLAFQLLFLVLFGVFVDYGEEANARNPRNQRDPQHGGAQPKSNELEINYSMFQDVHVMMFVGFGFLMMFLKRYAYSSVGINLLIASFVLQWATLMGGFMHLKDGHMDVNIITLLTSDFAAACVLISFGAVLGKVGPLQALVMAFIEVILFTVNEYIGLEMFKAIDMGGSMFVHVFGAYFGIFCARALYSDNVMYAGTKLGPSYTSDQFSMIGTIFLWVFWPSFNSALAPGDDRQRAVINTYYSLAACAVVSFAISSMTDKNDKLSMEHIQNSTLAGGVAVGTCADLMIGPWGAILIGCIAGIVSVLGYRFLSPLLSDKLKLVDTCGVNNLHGMPGILAAIAGVAACAMASEDDYGNSLYQIFPARSPDNSTLEGHKAFTKISETFSYVSPGEGRSAGGQAGYQAAALCVTLVISIVGGTATGLLMRIPIWDQPKLRQYYDDFYWHVPKEFHPAHTETLHYDYESESEETNQKSETSKV